MKQIKACGVVPVYRQNGEDLFLVILQKTGDWKFPKGHQEQDEGDMQTALRELEEETGIREVDIIPGETMIEEYDGKWNLSRYHKTVIYYVGFVFDTHVTIQESEIVDSAWLPYEQALERLTREHSKDTLKEAKKILERVETA